MIVNEYTKKELVNLSKTVGFDRFHRRMTVNLSEYKLNKIELGRFASSQPHLVLYFTVRGYEVVIQMSNFSKRLRINSDNRKSKETLRDVIIKAFDQTLKMNDVMVRCSCPDFFYRFSYLATRDDFGYKTDQPIPAPIRNPNGEGSMCKHLTRLLNSPTSWRFKVVTAIVDVLEQNPYALGGDVVD